MTSTVHRLKMTLLDIEPPVWRRIEVPSEVSLGRLAPVLEAAMGWESYHMHAFDVAGEVYGSADPEWDLDFIDETQHRLIDVLPATGATLRYDYDFGDGWTHEVLVEAIEPADTAVTYPVCIEGGGACPPEDCGGPWGYQHLLEVLGDPAHPEHEEMEEWVGPGFDPSRFDLSPTTARMRACLRPG